MATFSFDMTALMLPLLLIVFFYIQSPEKTNATQIGLINKIAFGLELLLTGAMLVLASIFLTMPNFLLVLLTSLSIISMLSIIVLILKTIMGSHLFQTKYIYASHLGVVLTLIGFLDAVFVEKPGYSSEPPLAILLFGILILIPYLHVMILHGFFRNI